MITLNVSICTCTSCIMNGNMDIYADIKNLKKLQLPLHFKKKIHIHLEKYISTDDQNSNVHQDLSPVVKIQDKIFHNAKEDVIMALVVEMCKKEED